MTNPVQSGFRDVANLFFSTTLRQKVLVQDSVPKNLFSASAVCKVAREAPPTSIGAYEQIASDLHRPPVSLSKSNAAVEMNRPTSASLAVDEMLL